MTSHFTEDKNPRNKKLMRRGWAVTGGGLCGLSVVTVLFLNGAVSLLTFILLALAGQAVVALGFGMMVVAADPFADCEIDSYSDSGTARHPPAQG